MKARSSSKWNEFFFTTVDARVYAALRIAVAVILAIHLAVLAGNWLMWFSDSGVLDRASARANIDEHTQSLFFWLSGSPATLKICLALIIVQLFAFGIGLATRFNSICLFIWLVSLHHRNNLIWEGEDLLLRIVCFLLIFMPLSQRWSLDAVIRKRRQVITSPESPPTASVWPLRLLQLELSCLYLSSVVEKLSGEYWRNGTAIQYVMRLDDVSGHRVPLANLFHYDLIGYQLLTWMTVGFEIMLAFLIWVPQVRRPIIYLGIAFHLGIELTMDLFLFQWIMILILSTHLVSPLGPGAAIEPTKNPQLK